MPLLLAAEVALRRALGDPSWRVRRAAAHALYAADVARSEAVATLLAGPRGVPGSALREAFSLDPLPPAVLADLWAIAEQLAGIAAPRASLVPIPVDEALSRLTQLVRRRHPVPAGLLDALWARVIHPAGAPDRGRVFRLYARLAPQDPTASARLVGLLDHSDAELRTAAFDFFSLDAQPPGAFAWIEAGLGDPSRCDRALELLDAIGRRLEVGAFRAAAGDHFVDALLAARAEPSPARRTIVIGALEGWVSERADVQAAVVAALDDPDAQVRRRAASGLHRCDDRREALMRAARDPDVNVRLAAAGALLSLERRPDIEVPFWRSLLTEPSLGLEGYAARRLAVVGAGDPGIVPLLVATLGSPREGVWWQALNALQSLAASGVREAIAALDVERRGRFRHVLDGRSPSSYQRAQLERWSARQRRLDALVAEGVSALVERLASLRGSVAARALAAIERLGEAASPAAPAIVALLGRAKSPRLRRRAARVLGCLGPAARDAATALLPLLDDPSDATRAAAARSLGRIGVVGAPS